MELRCKKVKDIVLENSASASVFFRYGIDYCNGNMSLEDLSGENSANIDEVLHDLENISHQGTPFYLWPLDLLLDYIIKYHHRNTKEKGAYLLSMIENVKDNYGMEYPELNELFNQVKLSMHDLESHFQKEESVLFPYLYEFMGHRTKRILRIERKEYQTY
jgi:regulator of cell morphogenesis and NO signaling